MKLRKFLTTSFILTSTSALAGTYTCEPCPVGKYLTSSGTCEACSGNSTTAWAVGSNTNPTCGFATRTVTKYCQASGSTTSTANPVSTQEVTYKGECGTNQVCDAGTCKNLSSSTTCSAGQGYNGTCYACLNGEYSAGGTAPCRACPENSSSNSTKSDCICNSGYFKSSNGKCKPIFYLYKCENDRVSSFVKTLNNANDSFTYINNYSYDPGDENDSYSTDSEKTIISTRNLGSISWRDSYSCYDESFLSLSDIFLYFNCDIKGFHSITSDYTISGTCTRK